MKAETFMGLVEDLAAQKGSLEQRRECDFASAQEAARHALADLGRGQGFVGTAISHLKDATQLLESVQRLNLELRYLNEQRGRLAEALGLEDA